MHAQLQKALLVADLVAGGVAVAALMKWLPPIAAAFTIVYTGLRIFDWFENRHLTKKKEKEDNK